VAKTIYEKIENKALKDAEEIIKIGRERARHVEERIISQAKATIEKNLEKVREKGREYLKTKTTELEQQAWQQVLSAKKELINSVFQTALERLNALNDDVLGGLVRKLILSESLKGDETILVNSRDYERYLRLFSDGKTEGEDVVLSKLNSVLGPDFRLRLGKKPANISGGFLVFGETFDIDMSFETLLRGLQEEHETEIARILFSRGE
jgi:vacuolar-type H+-ATPase subunit E/Vma4